MGLAHGDIIGVRLQKSSESGQQRFVEDARTKRIEFVRVEN